MKFIKSIIRFILIALIQPIISYVFNALYLFIIYLFFINLFSLISDYQSILNLNDYQIIIELCSETSVQASSISKGLSLSDFLNDADRIAEHYHYFMFLLTNSLSLPLWRLDFLFIIYLMISLFNLL